MKGHLAICMGALLASACGAGWASAAPAQPAFGGPVAVGDGVTIDPILDARLRWEDVDATTKSADAVTMRIRSGAEIRHAPSHLALLVEGTATLAIDPHYNAFPFASVSHQYRSAQAVVADPETIGLNRLQVQYATRPLTLTLGRQRINLDDQRFVGSVGWRQNEQTFDAVRAEVRQGPVTLDATYAGKQRTIYGNDAPPRLYYSGSFYFLNAGIKTRYALVKGFAYLLDYDRTSFINAAARSQLDSSQTYGLRATGSLPLNKVVALSYMGSWAVQSNYGNNLRHYRVEYGAAEGGLTVKNQTATVGYELLGSDVNAVGGAWAMQTPMATLHKFNGWADVFLTTPANGLTDTYVGLAGKFPKVKALPGLNYAASYHWYGSDIRSMKYGNEFNAQIGLRTGPITWLAKYADYQAKGFGVDTKKFWLQAEYGF
ncbi:MAG TPA: alginate export family protein [Novosphingobium sp.]|nr:alginate export family protein [Novosphingobium sp.]